MALRLRLGSLCLPIITITFTNNDNTIKIFFFFFATLVESVFSFFFPFLLTAFLVESLFSYFLVFFYKFPPQYSTVQTIREKDIRNKVIIMSIDLIFTVNRNSMCSHDYRIQGLAQNFRVDGDLTTRF